MRFAKLALLVGLLCGHLVWAQEPAADSDVTLKAYVDTPDSAYGWEIRESGTVEGCQWARLHMVSQTWKGVTWKHIVWMLVPETAKDSTHGVLYIAGGGWRPEWNDAGPERLPPSDEIQRMALLATASGSPVCVVQHVPFQPMFDGMVEDEIISKTFVEYLNTGDATWPLLLPMVKSAVRAMDTADQYMQKKHGGKLTKFTVFGGSKRGWTTWLSSAADPRVDALAPVVIDVLNMREQMKFQKETWGKYSEQIEDYSSKGIPEKMDTPIGRQLLSLVDPYEYRNVIQQPKLLIFGTNDRYWPVDACNLYWPALKGDKHLLYCPNQGHGIRDMERVLGSIAALQRSRTGGQPLPKMTWSFDPQSDKVCLNLSVDQQAEHVRCWVAKSETKDFREATWTDSPMRSEGDAYAFEVPRDGSYLALFGEVVIDNRPVDAFFSTNLRVFEPTSSN